MNFFDRHTLLKSLAVITACIFLLVLAYCAGVFLGVTPHVAMTYMTGGTMIAWTISELYDRMVFKRVDRQTYKSIRELQEQTKRLTKSVKELEKLNGTQKAPYSARNKK